MDDVDRAHDFAGKLINDLCVNKLNGWYTDK